MIVSKSSHSLAVPNSEDSESARDSMQQIASQPTPIHQMHSVNSAMILRNASATELKANNHQLKNDYIEDI